MLPARNLSCPTQRALRDGVYSEEEVLIFYRKILQDEEKYSSICRRVMGLLIAIIVLFQSMMLSHMPNALKDFWAYMLLINLGVLFFIYWYMRHSWIYSVRRQFLRNIKKSYPQIHYDLTD